MRSRSIVLGLLTTPLLPVCASLALTSSVCLAEPFFFSTGNVTNSIAIASRPDAGGKFEIEGADDFVTTGTTFITGASFTGLLTNGATAANVGEVRVEIYSVFPSDSDVGRTSGPPTFSTPGVPTRVNSPSDVAFDDRDSNPGGGLTFSTQLLGTGFTALNSVLPPTNRPESKLPSAAVTSAG